MVPFNFSAANFKLLALFVLLASKSVVNVASLSVKAWVPRLATVICGSTIFNGIVYSSLSSDKIFSASSFVIASSIPFFSA